MSGGTTLAWQADLAADDRRRRRRLHRWLALATLALGLAGLLVGAAGWSFEGLAADWRDDQFGLIVGQIRAPRTVGAWAVGALLGLGGAIAQGLFRNPLADPYLIGSAAGAGLAVVAVLAAVAVGSAAAVPPALGWLQDLGVVAAAFAGALGGVMLTLMVARGAAQTLRLLLAGVVVGVLLGAASDLVTAFVPQALRGKQAFLLGSTAYLGWSGVAWLLGGLALLLPLALRYARVLDALTLGEDSAASLGLDLPRLRFGLVALMALATGLAVSQAGLVAFVGLVAPHLVRRFAPGAQAALLATSAATGGCLLLAADVLARGLLAPQELPVGVLTALLGGGVLLRLLQRARA